MKKLLLIISLLVPLSVFSQTLTNKRQIKVFSDSSRIQLDTLSIVPESVFLFDEKGKLIPTNQYEIDPGNGEIIILSDSLINTSIDVYYRVFPLSLTKKYYRKDPNLIQPKKSGTKGFYYESGAQKLQDLYDKQKLDRSGSISRGISFGNNNDMAVNSNLNLQLSGRLSNDLYITAAITDNNIPLQPDGYSQQLQEFDKVYISIYNDKSRLTAGDFEINSPVGKYMQFSKKGLGGKYSTYQKLGKNKDISYKTTLAGAVSKGKFARNSFNGTEGNQGPYRLKGNNNESYIIVLAGSERVYMDGKLLVRGQENDYIINYNTAELTFTTHQLITKEKRILVEFEYAERNYTRFMLYTGNEIITKRSNYYFNIYTEQDSKNQTIQQELTLSDKQLLSSIGDSLHHALVPRYILDTVFDDNKVLYKMIDTTLLTGENFDSIFVFSTHPDSAIYRLSFSNVGENNGDYILSNSTANGKVYQWVAPISGLPQGNFEPIVLLITPKKKQVFTFGGKNQLSKNTTAAYEFGISNNDLNTFSDKDARDNFGYALNTSLQQKIPFKDSNNFILTGIYYELIGQHFDPVERFRNVEFERDWNLQNTAQTTEHILNYKLDWASHLHKTGYILSYMNRQNSFSGIKNDLNIDFQYKNTEFNASGSYLDSKDELNATQFLRHKGQLSQQILFTKIGVREESEQNMWRLSADESLLQSSYSFNEFTFFVQNPDTFINQYEISYTHRIEKLPDSTGLALATLADEYKVGFELLKFDKTNLKLTSGYRTLKIIDSNLTKIKPEEALIGRLEHNMFLFKRAVTTSTFYEIGTGLEAKKEFQYIEVAPGQGVYQWTDYNENGIKELDEFDVAQFQDAANYIRIFTPSTEYEKVYVNQFNQIINIKPYLVWRKSKGVKKFASMFSDQFAYKIDRKNIDDSFSKNINPFTQTIADQKIKTLSSSLKNTFSFNRTGSKFGIDYIYQNSKNRILLVYGLDTRTNIKNGGRIRWQPLPFATLKEDFDIGNKKYHSDFFTTKNYHISYFQNSFKIDFESAIRMRVTTGYNYKLKDNTLATEKSEKHEALLEFNYNALKKGIVTISANYIFLKYNAAANTPIAYEMLEGLLPGNNATWEVLFRRNLTDMLELNLSYAGRKSEGNKTIHTGGVQMRANF